MNPNESEQKKIIREWLDRAQADLESAQVLIKETDNYDIVAYHAHQAIEKYLKAVLLKNNRTFRFSHDLNSLFSEILDILPIQKLEEEISFVNSLYPKLRYPTGDSVTTGEAKKCLEIAQKILQIHT